MIEPINDYDIATLAKELYFNALGQNEVKIRTRQEAEQKWVISLVPKSKLAPSLLPIAWDHET